MKFHVEPVFILNTSQHGEALAGITAARFCLPLERLIYMHSPVRGHLQSTLHVLYLVYLRCPDYGECCNLCCIGYVEYINIQSILRAIEQHFYIPIKAITLVAMTRIAC